MKKIILGLCVLSLFVACGTHAPKAEPQGKEDLRGLFAVSWFQTSGEYRALCYQAFNSAKLYLEQDLQNKRLKGKRAIVLDLDETVVDNSPFQARAVKTGKGYPHGWKEWIDEANAMAVPGVVEFLQWVNKKGIAIYYISNRKIKGHDATVNNLKKLGIFFGEDKILLREKSSDKTPRRKEVMKTHRIVALFGDNLGDFSGLYDNKSIEERFAVVDKDKKEFGSHFIVLPNPMYGAWEGAVYNDDYSKTNAEKTEMMIKRLRDK